MDEKTTFEGFLAQSERKCPECGNKFFCYDPDNWGWSFGCVRLCSYHCMRAVDKRHKKQWERMVAKEAEEDRLLEIRRRRKELANRIGIRRLSTMPRDHRTDDNGEF